MSYQLFVSECCGGLFVPGHGPDNIVSAADGYCRNGFCPACDATAPKMELLEDTHEQ